MARLIEFFSRTGELVLDPFAGVGGTLLGRGHRPRAATGDRHRARPALGRGLRRGRRRDLLAERDGRGPAIADLGTADPGPVRSFDPAGLEMRTGDALEILPTLAGRVGRLRRDRSAVQHPAAADDGRRCALGRDPRQPADRLRDDQRRPGRPRQRARLRRVPRRDGPRLRRARPRPAAGPLRDRHRARRLPGRALPVRRRRPRGARRRAPGSSPRATSSGTRRGRGCARTATRACSSRTSPTSTSSCCAASRLVRRVGVRPAAALEVGGEDVAVDVVAHRPRVGSDRHRRRRGARDAAVRRSTSPSVILWIQPWRPSGHRTSQ